VIGVDLADPCWRCGELHEFVVVRGELLPCPRPRWTLRVARGLARALACFSKAVGQ
jgi:hypothetical protein